MAYCELKSPDGLNIVDSSEADNKRKRVVVCLEPNFVKNLENASYDVLEISPHN